MTVRINSAKLAQLAAVDDKSNAYDLEKFIELILALQPDEFDNFCRQIIHLRHFYDFNVAAYATDQIHVVKLNAEKFWLLKPLDFSEPVIYPLRNETEVIDDRI